MVLTGLCSGLRSLGAPFDEIVNLALDESANLIGMEIIRARTGSSRESSRACLAALESYSVAIHDPTPRSNI